MWPVADCDQAVECIVVPHYHLGIDRGYATIQTTAYFAWWQATAPSRLRVGATDGMPGKDWLDLNFDARFFGEKLVDLLGAPAGVWMLEKEFKGQSCHRGDSAELRFRRAHEKGHAVVHLRFLPDSLSLSVQFAPQLAEPHRIGRCVVAQGSRVNARMVFDTQPQASGIFHHTLQQLGNHGDHWLTPSPFACCFCHPDRSWSIAAIETPVLQMTFSRFFAQSRPEGEIEFVLDYKSLPLQSGAYTTPALVWRFNFSDEFDAIEGHARGMVQSGLVKPVDRTCPAWWSGTMVCGWHRQVELASRTNDARVDAAEEEILGATGLASSSDYATQEVYEHHVAEYEKAGISLDILTIDLGWSRTLGDWTPDPKKWPDMAAFIQRQHQRGRRVLLWICSSPDGLTPEERVGDLPCNERWRARLKKAIRAMLGPESNCLGADGLKFDFTGAKSKPCDQGTDQLHGYQYLFELYAAVSDEARAVRPDALLDYQAAHPQFAALHGMTRLNDFFISQKQALRVMGTRARIARAATFGGMVDTDCPAGVEYLRHAYEFGNISLYLTHEQLADPAIVAAVRFSQDHVRLRHDKAVVPPIS
jgi:hypothetical protein